MTSRDRSESAPGSFPISEKLTALDGESIYRTDEWWKALVVYRYAGADDSTGPSRAVYLWHKDDGQWTRKQKYLVRSRETWETDREHIEAFLEADSGDPASHPFDRDELPVSDYLTVGDAATVFKTDDWWKAVVRIDGKGDWETREVVVYVWQYADEKWRRRQKYSIKRISDWEEESAIISAYLDKESFAGSPSEEFDPAATKRDIQERLKRKHLGQEFE